MPRLMFYWRSALRYHDSERCEGYQLDGARPDAHAPRSGAFSRASRDGRVYCSTCRRRADEARGLGELADQIMFDLATAVANDDHEAVQDLVRRHGQRVWDAIPELRARGVRRGKHE